MDARDVTFEEGYRRLQGIAERLNSDEVPVHEMCDLFAEGTGLHQALGQYLREQRARVEAIERGEGVQPSASCRHEAMARNGPRSAHRGDRAPRRPPGRTAPLGRVRARRRAARRPRTACLGRPPARPRTTSSPFDRPRVSGVTSCQSPRCATRHTHRLASR